MRGSREISLVPSLHRASTDALIMIPKAPIMVPDKDDEKNYDEHK